MSKKASHGNISMNNVQGNDSREHEPFTGRSVVKRTSKACEACRSRRRRCDGAQPCQTCILSGKSGFCHFRSKTRPRRALPSIFQASITSEAAGPSETTLRGNAQLNRSPLFFEIAENRLEGWAREKGKTVDLSIDNSLAWSRFLNQPLPLIPGDAKSRALAMETYQMSFMEPSMASISTIASQLLHQFETSPDLLSADQLALVLSCLCIGRHRELVLARDRDDDRALDENVEPEDVSFFRLALAALDQWVGVSSMSIAALHSLHLFAHHRGGPDQIRAILGRMGWQCKEMGLHRFESCKLYTESDHVEQLFFGAFYKDTWFATLSESEPFFKSGEFEYTWSNLPTKDDSYYALERYTVLIDLTVIENDLLSILCRRPLSFDHDITSFESRLAGWLNTFRAEQQREKRHIMSGFIEIRFHWLRLMLRVPYLSHNEHGMNCRSIAARSSAHILRVYSSISSTVLFGPRWSDARRIITAAYVVILCLMDGELKEDEARPLMELALNLLKVQKYGSPAAKKGLESLKLLMDLAGIGSSIYDDEMGEDDVEATKTIFDFSLPC